MDKKGFTLMEIIVSVALLSIVMLLLFQLMIDLEYEDSHSSFAKDNQIKRATIIKRVEKDMMDKGLSLVSLNKASDYATLTFKYNNSNVPIIIHCLFITIYRYSITIYFSSFISSFSNKSITLLVESDILLHIILYISISFISSIVFPVAFAITL